MHVDDSKQGNEQLLCNGKSDDWECMDTMHLGLSGQWVEVRKKATMIKSTIGVNLILIWYLYLHYMGSF